MEKRENLKKGKEKVLNISFALNGVEVSEGICPEKIKHFSCYPSIRG